MLTLAINTASSSTGIALIDENLLGEYSWPAENREAEKLLPSIQNLLRENGRTPQDLKAILAVSGPGSFTGLRIGVTTANTMAHLLGCKLFAIDTLNYWHQSAKVQGLDLNLPIFVFAGKGAVYLSRKNFNVELIDLPDLPAAIKKYGLFKATGDLSQDQKGLLWDHGVEWVSPSPSHTFGEVCCSIMNLDLKPISMIKPLYIKEPGITISKKSNI